jgi:hypothetical protein
MYRRKDQDQTGQGNLHVSRSFRLYFQIDKSLLKLALAALSHHIAIASIGICDLLNRNKMIELKIIAHLIGDFCVEIYYKSVFDSGCSVLRINAVENNLGLKGKYCIR